MGQVIALKNSKKMIEKNQYQKKADENHKRTDKNEKNKKERQKPKTTLDFGEGIITGIMNFLNF